MVVVLLMIAALGILYYLGYLPVSVKRAVTYVGHGSNGASFTSCTGTIRRVIRFREYRSYSFHLTGHIQQGSVTAVIQGRGRTPLLTLTAANPSGILSVSRGERYTLIMRFESASGDYQLDWT